MIFQKTSIDNLLLIKPELLEDGRGYFTRTFCVKEFGKLNISFEILQTSISYTKPKGTLRGLHFQIAPFEETKIVQCLKGCIFDVVIDLRPGSKTYGNHETFELNGQYKHMLYIPRGVAHGFQTLTEDCEVLYYMSEYYSGEHARGIRWNDPKFNIQWPLKNPILSDKDQSWPEYKL
ncbi:MAG: dTDP-4-dehydrorhamnose 3,5-epimerase [Candidatus Daviesbacteria bacterium]|nr:dTDP-4-dehydrorhamnose 3,5-epimerase [Candidatus Daviesbacteria bacterium]